MKTQTILRAEQISLAYQNNKGKKHTVLRGLDIDLKRGELLTILGPSGAGKSSLLRVLAGLQSPQTGAVFLADERITCPHPHTAFVFQQANLLPWLTVAQNTALGLSFARQKKSTQPTPERVQAALSEVGLADKSKLHPAALSGGMAQRVALARALVRQPAVIFLDEPFSALDEITRRQMQILLHRLIDKHHTAAVLVTHDIDEALAVSNRIILLGEKPARQMGQWHISANRTDCRHIKEEIMATLHQAQQYQQQTATIEFVI